MKDYKLPRDKHLTLEVRQEIEKCLDMGGITFKDIARRVGKSKTTISREVKKHLVYKEAPVVYIMLLSILSDSLSHYLQTKNGYEESFTVVAINLKTSPVSSIQQNLAYGIL